MIEPLKKNLAVVRDRINVALRRVGRPLESVRLVGVTKYVNSEVTAALIQAGCWELGENRPQVLWDKATVLNDPRVKWHLIGHLQRNKVKRTVELATLIHSVDSLRLLRSIDDAGRELNRVACVLLEVNVSGEAAKHGFSPGELAETIEQIAGLDHVKVEGLMCMAGLTSDADGTRREFAELRELATKQQASSPDNVELKELSMGMSGDFEVAIEEGATIVRVGSLLFEDIE